MNDDSARRRRADGSPRPVEPVTPTMAFPPVPAAPVNPTLPMPMSGRPAPAPPPRTVQSAPPQAASPYPVPMAPAPVMPAADPYAAPGPYAPDPYAPDPYAAAPAPGPGPAGWLSAGTTAPNLAAQVARRAATNALTLLAVVNAVFLLAVTVPEIVPWWPMLFEQLAPLVAGPLATGGEELVNNQGPGLVQTLMVLTAFVAYVAAHRQGQYRMVGLCAAGATVVLAVLTGLMGLVVMGRSGALGAALAGIVALLAARTANAMRTPVGPRADRIGTTFVWSYALSFVIPLGVGRALFSPELAEVARGLASTGEMNQRFLALGHWATLWLYLGGVSVGVVFWVVLQLIPPWRGRPLVRPIATALLVLAIGWVWVGWQASETGKDRAEQLLTEHPQIRGATPGGP